MHKDTIQYGQESDTSKLKSFKTDDIPPLLRMCIIAINYIQTKVLSPQLYKQILPSETIKHQPYKQITTVYMAGI